ncbi:MAG: hypothetical protein PVG08_21405 [Desulfobacterales bacterium]
MKKPISDLLSTRVIKWERLSTRPSSSHTSRDWILAMAAGKPLPPPKVFNFATAVETE